MVEGIKNRRHYRFWEELQGILKRYNKSKSWDLPRLDPKDLSMDTPRHLEMAMQAYHQSLFPIYLGQEGMVNPSASPHMEIGANHFPVAMNYVMWPSGQMDVRQLDKAREIVERCFYGDFGCTGFSRVQTSQGKTGFKLEAEDMKKIRQGLKAIISKQNNLSAHIPSLESLREAVIKSGRSDVQL